MTSVVSLDLAIRRVADNGLVVLEARGARVIARRVPLAERLEGGLAPEALADTLVSLAHESRAVHIVVDGPQAWRAEQSPHVHQRDGEKALHTPGKTGPPGVVKPASWTRFAEFSVALFDALAERGFPRLEERTQGRAAIESFPTAAWRALGLRPLPGKARARADDLHTHRAELASVVDVALDPPFEPSHDELQAIAGGLAGLGLGDAGGALGLGASLHGLPPVVEAGVMREGFLVTPQRA